MMRTRETNYFGFMIRETTLTYHTSAKGAGVIRVLLTVALLLFATAASGQVLELRYEGFTVWLDCSKRGAIRFEYMATQDTGSLPRKSSFKLDPNVPAHCQQISAKTYKHSGVRYDRGHMVPANHLDHSKTAIAQSNFMTNILPQAANTNRGAWLLTEEVVECYRDVGPLHVIGGVIWGNDPSDDYFVGSHAVATPDAYWKVVVARNRVIAWVVPNRADAKRKKLDQYIVSLSRIETMIGESLPITEALKQIVPARSWILPRGCNKG